VWARYIIHGLKIMFFIMSDATDQNNIGKQDTILGLFIFLSIEEYKWIMFLGFKIDECRYSQ
jgi:hypothetical protein